MRENNIYYADYLKQLKDDNITIGQEIQDILDLIKDKTGDWYNAFREKVKTFGEHLKTGKGVKIKRKTLTPQEYLQTFVCDPTDPMCEIERRRPWIQTPIGDGRYSVRYDLTEDEKKEYRLLHWIYIELETIDERLRRGEAYGY